MDMTRMFGDRNSFAMRMIRRRAERLCRHSALKNDREDMEQELALRVLQNARRFDPGRGDKKAFLRRMIDNAAISVHRASRAAKRDSRRCAGSLDEAVRDRDGDVVERAQILDDSYARRHLGQEYRIPQEAARLRMDVDAKIESLPEDSRELVDALRWKSESEAGRELGLSRRQLRKKMTELSIRNDLKNLA